MSTTVQQTKVKAVQESGYANVWYVQTETGATVARMTVDANAEAWAKRIESALNAKSDEQNKAVANTQALADEYSRLIRHMDAGGDFFAFQVEESRRRNGLQTKPNWNR